MVYNGIFWGWADNFLPPSANTIAAIGKALNGDFSSLANFEDSIGDLGSDFVDLSAEVSSAELSELDTELIDAVDATLPEPGSLALLGAGLIGLVFCRRKRAARQSQAVHS
jgi:PEP-CTERM motif